MDKTVIIIPVFEEYERLQKALSSIDMDKDVLCIDNSYHKKPIRSHLDTIQVFETKANIGFGRACNLGVQKARELGYQKAIISNQDVRFAENCIENLIQAIDRDPDSIWVPVVHKYQDVSIEDYVLKSYGATFQEDWNNQATKDYYTLSFTGLCCFAMHLDLLDKHPLFDPLFFMYWEDNDFLKRVQDRGGELRLLTEAHLHHKGKEEERDQYRDKARYRTSQSIYYLRWEGKSMWKTQYEMLRGCLKYMLKLDFSNAFAFIKGMFFLWSNAGAIRDKTEEGIESRIEYYKQLDQVI